MPRYFFHVRSAEGLEVDTEGLEFDSLEEAIADAERGGRELLADSAFAGATTDTEKVLEITDPSGRVLVVLPFLPR